MRVSKSGAGSEEEDRVKTGGERDQKMEGVSRVGEEVQKQAKGSKKNS